MRQGGAARHTTGLGDCLERPPDTLSARPARLSEDGHRLLCRRVRRLPRRGRSAAAGQPRAKHLLGITYHFVVLIIHVAHTRQQDILGQHRNQVMLLAPGAPVVSSQSFEEGDGDRGIVDPYPHVIHLFYAQHAVGPPRRRSRAMVRGPIDRPACGWNCIRRHPRSVCRTDCRGAGILLASNQRPGLRNTPMTTLAFDTHRAVKALRDVQ